MIVGVILEEMVEEIVVVMVVVMVAVMAEVTIAVNFLWNGVVKSEQIAVVTSRKIPQAILMVCQIV